MQSSLSSSITHVEVTIGNITCNWRELAIPQLILDIGEQNLGPLRSKSLGDGKGKGNASGRRDMRLVFIDLGSLLNPKGSWRHKW